MTLVVRENNIGENARKTDYFICDIEYMINVKEEKCKFDMICVHWPSNNDEEIEIAIIEMKYFEKSIASRKPSKEKRKKDSAGLYDHAKDFGDLLSDKRLVDCLKNDAKNTFNQKRNLGLLNCGKDIKSISGKNPCLLLLLANYYPDSEYLKRELIKIREDFGDLDIRFAVGNFMGYGLYDQSIYTFDCFEDKFSKQIYSKCK